MANISIESKKLDLFYKVINSEYLKLKDEFKDVEGKLNHYLYEVNHRSREKDEELHTALIERQNFIYQKLDVASDVLYQLENIEEEE